jgi:L-threonylcarbamoyladenylate synthase
MEIISNPTQVEIRKAAQALKDGHLVAFPTETVYGLGADATNEKAVSRVYSVKGRPNDHPLIVHISDGEKLPMWATSITSQAQRLAENFWPGPLTLVLPSGQLMKNFLRGDQNFVALRVPSNKIARQLLINFENLGGKGVVAPSANKFGAVSPTDSSAVKEELGENLRPQDVLIDGGKCEVGIESTIIRCSNDGESILRLGVITKSQIETITKRELLNENFSTTLQVPGTLLKHYSPNAKVLINGTPLPGEGLIALSNIYSDPKVIRLASPKNSTEYAHQLYRALRYGDQMKLKIIRVILPRDEELSESICDRVNRAAN